MNYDFFEPLPKIIPVGKTTEFVLRGRYMQRQISFMTKDARLELETIPVNGLFPDGKLPDWAEMRQHPFTIPENDPDSLHFTVTPEDEGEIVFLLYQKFPAERGMTMRRYSTLNTEELGFYNADLEYVVEPGKFTAKVTDNGAPGCDVIDTSFIVK